MLRPRQTPSVRVLHSEIILSEAGTLVWSEDIFGNAVAEAQFSAATDNLVIEAMSRVEIDAATSTPFNLSPAADTPFRYSDEESLMLGAFLARLCPAREDRVGDWARSLVPSCPAETLCLLEALSAGMMRTVRYQPAGCEGIQSPAETLACAFGASGDLAVLFADAARSLGFAARIVSGYVFTRVYDFANGRHADASHFWAEIFLPGKGWTLFDPVHSGLGPVALIPVAVAALIGQAMPVTARVAGPSEALKDVAVSICVLPVKADRSFVPSNAARRAWLDDGALASDRNYEAWRHIWHSVG